VGAGMILFLPGGRDVGEAGACRDQEHTMRES